MSLIACALVSGETPARAVPVSAIVALGIAAAGSFAAIAVTVIVNVGLALLAGALFAPKLPHQDRQASETQLQIGEQPRQALFGTAATAGSLVDAFNYGGTYGTDWECVNFALADHRCDSLLGFYVNDTYHAYTGDGLVPGFNNQLYVYWLSGTADQIMPDLVRTYAPDGWTDHDHCAGVSCAIVSYMADAPTAKNPVWPGGRPTFLWVLKGKHCYDPRKDSTVTGGSGAHRWSDSTTWEYSENPPVCRYNWVRGVYACDNVDHPDQLLVGRGLSAIEAPPANVAAYANICDEQVPSPGGGTENRYRLSGLVSAADDYITTEEMFAAACAGTIVQPQGSVEIEPGHVKTPVVTITDDDIVAGEPIIFTPFRSESDSAWVNTVVPTYVEPTQKWADHAAPIRRVYSDVIADGKPREDPLSLSLVTWASQAQRCGEITRRLGRLPRTATLTLGPRFAAIEDGDWIIWNSARRGNHTYRVEAYGLSKEWRNTLQLREIASSVYDFAASDYASDGATAVNQAAPAGEASARGAYVIKTRDVDYPLTSNDNSISIAAFNGVLDDGTSESFAAGSVTGLTAGTAYGVFFRTTDSVYFAQASPALVGMASALCVFLGWQKTSSSGSYTPPATPPGGYGGGGGGNGNTHLD